MPIISGGGGGGGSTLGPFRVNFNTANFFNPADNGAQTLAIPAGTLIVQAFVIVATTFETTAAGDELTLTLVVNAPGSGPVLCGYSGNELAANTPAVGLQGAQPLDITTTPVAARAVVDTHIFAAFYPAGATTLTAGALDVYALTA